MNNAFSTAITCLTGNAPRRDSSLQVNGGLRMEEVKSTSYPDNDVFEVMFCKEEKTATKEITTPHKCGI